jgi:hypothetical protein
VTLLLKSHPKDSFLPCSKITFSSTLQNSFLPCQQISLVAALLSLGAIDELVYVIIYLYILHISYHSSINFVEAYALTSWPPLSMDPGSAPDWKNYTM